MTGGTEAPSPGFRRILRRELHQIATRPVLACIAMGFAIALAIPWREGVVYFLVVLGMPLFFLSGISWPVQMTPRHPHSLSLLVPSSSAITAFVAVNQMGATAHDMAGPIEPQVALAFDYTALAMGIFRLTRHRRLRDGQDWAGAPACPGTRPELKHLLTGC